MELAKIEEPKGLAMPFRTLPEEKLNSLVAYVVSTLEVKLSIKSESEENQKRIMALLNEVKKSMWGLTPEYILKAFDAYVNGQLSYDNKPLTPVSGYLDIILFKKVVNAYKALNEPKQDLRAITLGVWEEWKEKKEIQGKGINEAFDYLYENGVLPNRDENQQVKDKYTKLMNIAKGHIYAVLLDKRKWMEKEDLADTKAYKELIDEMQSVVHNDHKDILPKFKSMVLEGYFKKLKHDLNKVI